MVPDAAVRPAMPPYGGWDSVGVGDQPPIAAHRRRIRRLAISRQTPESAGAPDRVGDVADGGEQSGVDEGSAGLAYGEIGEPESKRNDVC